MREYVLNGGHPSALDQSRTQLLHVALKKGGEIFSMVPGIFPVDYRIDGLPIISIASRHNQLPTVKYLVANGADINLMDNNGVSPMEHASIGQHQDLFRFFLLNNAKADRECAGPAVDCICLF